MKALLEYSRRHASSHASDSMDQTPVGINLRRPVMGLDTIELIVAIEDKFSIQIPNGEAPKLAVLGDMHDYIMHILRRRGETPDEAQVWESLKAIVVELLCVGPEKVTRAAHIVRDLGAD